MAQRCSVARTWRSPCRLDRAPAGKLADGTTVEVITLTGGNGVTARILSYGATLQSLDVPGRDGKTADVVLGYDDPATYQRYASYIGATIGRYANRIGGATFQLDGKTYHVSANEAGNSLHGGGKGFDKVVWQVVSVESGPVAKVVFAHTSPAGDAGYPGKLEVRVTYSLDEHGSLGITYDARTDAPTVVNLTNHALFNMAGEGAPHSALDNVLTIPAKAYTPIDAKLIPTGELRAVAGTPFDFRSPRRVGDDIRDGTDEQLRFGRGYDHNFAIDKGVSAQPELLARLEDPVSGPRAGSAVDRTRSAVLCR